MRPKIAFCVITEGDTKLSNLKKLLNSVNQYVDGVFITANGGEDKVPTKDLKKWCSHNGYNFTFKPWEDDFGGQRNFNWSQVPDDFEFILWADSDDVIVGAKMLPYIAEVAQKNGHDAVFFEYWYGCNFKGEPSPETLVDVEIKQMRERLIRRGSITWKNRIHETPVPVNGVNFKYTRLDYTKEFPIAWLHLGATRQDLDKGNDKRMVRNRRLLEKQLEDERKQGSADPRTLLYLMKIYKELDDPELKKECIAMGEEYMQKSGWDAERAICATLMASCYEYLGQDQKALDFLHKAISEYPLDPLLYLYLSRAYYNTRNMDAMEHWLMVALNMNPESEHTAFQNLLEMKVMFANLLTRLYLEHPKKRNVRKAYEYAKTVYDLNPKPDTKNNMDYLYDLKRLDEASENAHKYLLYLDEVGKEEEIVSVIDTFPKEMRDLPFANSLYNRYATPKVWANNEICYYANFNGNHFEKWDANSLSKGIGGSETAVIRLAQEWTKLGYKVTVYGDPKDGAEIDGVTYLSWRKFNPKDYFNIFIQWRAGYLAGKINCKKFLVDLHDVWSEVGYLRKQDSIDAFMVKSNYHRGLAPSIPDVKFSTISNGI